VSSGGKNARDILSGVVAGTLTIAPIQQWDVAVADKVAGEIPNFNAREMVEDRKLHKLIRRTDLFGLYAAGRAIEEAGLAAYRETLPADAAATFNDRTGVYVGSGSGNFENQYDYFPLLAAANGSLPEFGRELANTVNPMWLLRSLPNNVLGHIGIKYGLKGSNACITSHSCSGSLAVIEGMEALRHGEADRVVAVGHDAPIEPQMVLYYYRLGLIASDTLRPFDVARDGSVFGEVAGALVLEFCRGAKCKGAGRSAGWRPCFGGDGSPRHSRRRRRPCARDCGGAGRCEDQRGGRRHDRRPRQRHEAIRCVGSGGDPHRVRGRPAAGDRIQMVVRTPDRGGGYSRGYAGARSACRGRGPWRGHAAGTRSGLRGFAGERTVADTAQQDRVDPLPRIRRHGRGAVVACRLTPLRR
jgi:hypothetical protein